MSFNYRFSVIPAGAIIDPRLTPRALQALCLLGRHTNDNGWCSRSQVKMARELGCGRSTLYDAFELLRESGWIERRANGRGSTGPETSEHPFAAYSYRVILDRDDLPERLAPALASNETATGAPDEGAAQAAGGAAIPAGGAAIPAPLEGNPSKGISSEPERESAPAREKRARGLATFEQRWPTAAVDDRGKTAYAWDALTEDERDEAVARIGAFLDSLKRHKRTAVPAGWKYLEQKRWRLLETKPPTEATTRFSAIEDSAEWKAWAVFYRCCGQYSIPGFLISGDPGRRIATVPEQWPPVGREFDLEMAEWRSVFEGDGQFAAWLRRLRELKGVSIATRTTIRDGKSVQTLSVPDEWPPNKGPPDQTFRPSGLQDFK
jgi:hypothetical protein